MVAAIRPNRGRWRSLQEGGNSEAVNQVAIRIELDRNRGAAGVYGAVQIAIRVGHDVDKRVGADRARRSAVYNIPVAIELRDNGHCVFGQHVILLHRYHIRVALCVGYKRVGGLGILNLREMGENQEGYCQEKNGRPRAFPGAAVEVHPHYGFGYLHADIVAGIGRKTALDQVLIGLLPNNGASGSYPLGSTTTHSWRISPAVLFSPIGKSDG